MAVADPVRQRVIGVKIPASSIGEYAKVTNLTSGGQFYGRIAGVNREIIISPGEDFTWKNDDIIQAEIHGRINGYARGTIQAGGLTLTVNTSTDTTTPGADL